MSSASWLNRLATLVLVFITLAVLFLFAIGIAEWRPVQDMGQYWTAVHLIRQNPYSPQLVAETYERVFRTHGSAPPVVLLNTPWAIVMLTPLSLFNYAVSFALCILVSIALVAFCSRSIWNSISPKESLAPAFLSLFFGPTLILLMLGQIDALVLLGITLYTKMVGLRRDWCAGASLLLIFLKPHSCFLYLLLILLWVIHSRRWAILLSASLGFALVTCAAIVINHQIFSQYLTFMRSSVPTAPPYPNVSGIIYALTGVRELAYIPEVAGLIWLVGYWRRRKNTWNWSTDGAMVLLVSVICSYYSWPYSEILVLPALLLTFATGNRRVFLAGFISVNLAYAVFIVWFSEWYTYRFLSWTGLAWLVSCVLSRSQRLRTAFDWKNLGAKEMEAPELKPL